MLDEVGRELVERGRREEALVARADQRRVAGQRGEARGARGVFRAFVLAQLLHARAGREDRLIAGAAAQIAGERVGELVPLVLVMRVERHYETRRAETALRSVAVDHRLLRRMQGGAALQRLDRDALASGACP